VVKQLLGLLAGNKSAEKVDKAVEFTFCESCGEVCGNGCRSEGLLERAKEKSTLYQGGVTPRF